MARSQPADGTYFFHAVMGVWVLVSCFAVGGVLLFIARLPDADDTISPSLYPPSHSSPVRSDGALESDDSNAQVKLTPTIGVYLSAVKPLRRQLGLATPAEQRFEPAPTNPAQNLTLDVGVLLETYPAYGEGVLFTGSIGAAIVVAYLIVLVISLLVLFANIIWRLFCCCFQDPDAEPSEPKTATCSIKALRVVLVVISLLLVLDLSTPIIGFERLREGGHDVFDLAGTTVDTVSGVVQPAINAFALADETYTQVRTQYEALPQALQDQVDFPSDLPELPSEVLTFEDRLRFTLDSTRAQFDCYTKQLRPLVAFASVLVGVGAAIVLLTFLFKLYFFLYIAFVLVWIGGIMAGALLTAFMPLLTLQGDVCLVLNDQLSNFSQDNAATQLFVECSSQFTSALDTLLAAVEQYNGTLTDAIEFEPPEIIPAPLVQQLEAVQANLTYIQSNVTLAVNNLVELEGCDFVRTVLVGFVETFCNVGFNGLLTIFIGYSVSTCLGLVLLPMMTLVKRVLSAESLTLEDELAAGAEVLDGGEAADFMSSYASSRLGLRPVPGVVGAERGTAVELRAYHESSARSVTQLSRKRNVSGIAVS